MAWRIVKQPNGKYARFSEVVDDFTDYDMTSMEALDLCEKLAGKETGAVKFARSHVGPSRFEEAIETIREVHGDTISEERKRELSAE